MVDQASNDDATNSRVMTLNVGGRKFQTTSETLRAESGLFRHQLSDRFTWNAEDDGSYFLDAERKAYGFDYDLYNRLEVEAEYFQIDSLRDWIKDKKYLRAVVVHAYAADVHGLDEELPATLSINQTEERHYMTRVRKVYVCPREIHVHQGNPYKCDIACRRAQGDDEVQFEEEPYTVVVRVKKESEHKAGLCRLG